VIITGEILNYQPGISRDFIEFFIDDFLTGDNRALNIPISASGSFKIRFTATLANTPALSYYSIIPCFIHPGDSLHVELDATDTIPNQPGYVRFSGDRSKENEALLAYSHIKISHIEKERKKFAMRDSLNLRDWILYVQRFGEERNREIADFLAKINPPSEIVDWIHDQEKSMYYFDIKSYRYSDKIENHEEEHFDLLVKFLDIPPLEKNQLSSPYARTVVNIQLEKHRPNQNNWKGKLGDFIRSMDSTTLANILAEPVNLTQQLVLATFGHNALEAGKMTFFEDHLPVFNEA
jgi:hypothetical protein